MAASMDNNVEWYCWGANSYGQLCVGHTEDQLLPVPASTLQGATQLCGGGGHTFASTADHQNTVCCGWNNKGQLGVAGGDITSPVQLTSAAAPVFSSMRAGWDFTLAWTPGGELFSWGSNMYGQLGQPGVTASAIHTPTRVEDIEPVKDAACGLRHSVICTVSGDVMCCGYGKKGQLGQEIDGKPIKESRRFTKVHLPGQHAPVSQVAAGAYHSAALTEAGEVYVWGDNKHGQLALPPSPLLPTPHCLGDRLAGGERVLQLHSGWTHMLAVTDDGGVYTWGRGDYGQLGRPLPTRMDHVPTRLPVPVPGKVAVGAEHNLLLTERGEVLTWGWNEHGLCATGDEVNKASPSPVQYFSGHRVLDIATGMGHCFARVERLT